MDGARCWFTHKYSLIPSEDTHVVGSITTYTGLSRRIDLLCQRNVSQLRFAQIVTVAQKPGLIKIFGPKTPLFVRKRTE